MPGYDTLSVLKRISDAYPYKHLDEGALQVYQDKLADIPTPWLVQAVRKHIQTSPWFPHVSDLRQAAQQLAGTAQFSSLLEPGINFIALEAHQLENDDFQQGEFDPLAWDGFASQFDNVGRPHRAIELRQKAQHIQEAEAAHARGEEYPPRTERLRYAALDTRA